MTEIKNGKLKELIQDDKNMNKHNEYGMSLLEKSISKYGLGRSILVDKNNKIIAGNGVTETAANIGLDDVIIVPTNGRQLVVVQRTDLDLDSKEARELALADNAVAHVNLEWDEEQLQAVTEEWGIDVKEWGVDLPEFENVEEVEAQEDDFDVPEGGIETDIIIGDLFEIGEHRLLCGDSTDSDSVAKLMNGSKADMVFTDPPYGVDYKGINNDSRSGLEFLLNSAFQNYLINSKEGASVYCFHSDKCADIFNQVFRSYCHFSSMIIWVKESIVLSQTDYQSKHEPCFYGWLNNGTHKWYSDRKQESVWIAKSKREEGHTTPKPIEVVSKAINNSSKENHLVFDLFLGSGSTMVAAHQLNRKCYGMELDPKYCQVIVDRMIKLDPTLEIKRNGELYIRK